MHMNVVNKIRFAWEDKYSRSNDTEVSTECWAQSSAVSVHASAIEAVLDLHAQCQELAP